MNIYVSNLKYGFTEDELRQLFEKYGEVQSVKIITDRDSGRSKGYGFVEMDKEPGDLAIAGLNNMEIYGRQLKVNEARDRKPEEGERRSRGPRTD